MNHSTEYIFLNLALEPIKTIKVDILFQALKMLRSNRNSEFELKKKKFLMKNRRKIDDFAKNINDLIKVGPLNIDYLSSLCSYS